jgi:hypothetical protein
VLSNLEVQQVKNISAINYPTVKRKVLFAAITGAKQKREN